MRILHVTSDWKWTGPAEPMLHAAAGLRARGHQVDLAFPEPPEGHVDGLGVRARERGLEPVATLARGRGYRPWRDRSEVTRLRALVEARAYDVVHAHHSRDQILAALALRRSRGRLVTSWHHGEPIPLLPWNRLLYGPRVSRGLVVLTPRVAEAARAGLGGPAERVAVVRGSVDGARFRPRERKPEVAAELGLAPGERVVGLVARLQPHRRVDLLLDALERALPRAPGLRLLVIGRGTRARQVLEAPVCRRGLQAAVVRAGYRRHDYVDVLAQCDALVFLVPGSDGSCRAVLEAMAMEIPTVASGRGALPDIVEDGRTGLLVDERPDALAEALIDVWRDPAAWRARGKAARRRALERHTPEGAAVRLERLYASVVGGLS